MTFDDRFRLGFLGFKGLFGGSKQLQLWPYEGAVCPPGPPEMLFDREFATPFDLDSRACAYAFTAVHRGSTGLVSSCSVGLKCLRLDFVGGAFGTTKCVLQFSEV